MLHKVLSLILFVCCFASKLIAQPLIVVDSVSQELIGNSMLAYSPGKEMSIEEVVEQTFLPLENKVPNLGVSRQSIWLKLRVQNKSPLATFVLYIDNPTLDEAELFWRDGPELPFRSKSVSKVLPLSVRQYKGSDVVFRMDQTDSLPKEYYLRVKGEQPIILPVSINLPNAQLAEMLKKNWLNGIYFGFVLIMAVYNYFIFVSVKDSSYLYYVIFILFAGITQLTLKGLSFQYFWPEFPLMEKYGMVLSASVSGAAGLLFTARFLRLKKDFPLLNKIAIYAVIPFVISIVLIPFSTNLAFIFMRNATSLGAIIALLTSIYVYRKSRKMAHLYFMLAWSILLLGSIVYLLYSFGYIRYSTFSNYSVQLASAIEMTLLSLALASRINILEKEKEQSRRAALQLARENARIINEQNQHLELQVNKRTEELVQKNEIINATYQDLKEAQSKLVAAEKMSSLGQLTAGIAHEINNPINFVAANINPLQRDFSMLLNLVEDIESIGDQDLDTVTKKQKIEKVKSDIDFDYLKTEINFLMKGIQEGATRTADIIKGLRVFSRVDEAELKTADINEGIRSTLVIINNQLNNIDVDVDLNEIPELLCYPGKLNQVFLNLMTNAVAAIKEKFGEDKGGHLVLRSYRIEEEGCIAVLVQDNGIGMDQNTIDKLYEPFFTTKKVGEGMGLGMSIVFSIIQEHKAQLIVDSTLGSGTSFILKLCLNNKYDE